jgi:hypothetical protein
LHESISLAKEHETDSLLSEQLAIPEMPVAASKSALPPLAHKEF